MAMCANSKNNPGGGGYLIDNSIYVTALMYFFKEKKNTNMIRLKLPKFFSTSQWKPIRIVVHQKKMEVWDAKVKDAVSIYFCFFRADSSTSYDWLIYLYFTLLTLLRKNYLQDMLSGLMEPKFVIEMHRLLSLTPLKVYASDHDTSSGASKEMLSLSIRETDARRKNDQIISKSDDLVRFGIAHPHQFTFFQTMLRSILDSFHR